MLRKEPINPTQVAMCMALLQDRGGLSCSLLTSFLSLPFTLLLSSPHLILHLILLLFPHPSLYSPCIYSTPPFSCINSYEDKVEHYRVRRDERTWVTVDDDQFFENLFKLVEVSRCGVYLSTQLVMINVLLPSPFPSLPPLFFPLPPFPPSLSSTPTYKPALPT